MLQNVAPSRTGPRTEGMNNPAFTDTPGGKDGVKTQRSTVSGEYFWPNTHSEWSTQWSTLDIVASELKDPIWHSSEWQIGSFSSEATIWKSLSDTCKVADTPFHVHGDNQSIEKLVFSIWFVKYRLIGQKQLFDVVCQCVLVRITCAVWNVLQLANESC